MGARILKQAASISPTSLRSEASPLGKRQEEVLPMAKLEQRRYKEQKEEIKRLRLNGKRITRDEALQTVYRKEMFFGTVL